MRMEHGAQPRLLRDDVGEFLNGLDELVPTLDVKLLVLEVLPGEQVPVHRRQEDEVGAADGGGEARRRERLLLDRLEVIGAVECSTGRAGRDAKVPLGQFVGKLHGVGGQESVRAELHVAVTRLCDLIEIASAGGLPGTVGHPYAPRVGG